LTPAPGFRVLCPGYISVGTSFLSSSPHADTGRGDGGVKESILFIWLRSLLLHFSVWLFSASLSVCFFGFSFGPLFPIAGRFAA